MIGRNLGVLGAGAALWGAVVTPAVADAPSVVASIQPIHSLVAGVMGDVGKPALLVKGAASPHTYSMRPSDAEALQAAHVVFWVGEDLETFLEKPLEALPRDARIVALHETKGVKLLSSRESHHGEEHGDEHAGHHGEHHDDKHKGEHHADEHHGEHHGDEDEHAHGETDMHIWLDPANAKVMVAQIVATLSDADPANASRYKKNGALVHQRLADLDADLARDLAPVKDRSYVVFHDAYAYFENRYGLSPAGTITVSPDRKPSARRLTEIRERIAETGAACVFSEPQFEPAVVRTVIEGTGARIAVLDPLGADLEPGADAYFALMRNLAASLKGCLTPAS